MSLLSEGRLRGYSLSAEHPVAQLDLSYDHPTGFYFGLSASVVAHEGIKPLGLQESIGFAKKLGKGPTIDVGIVNSDYTRHSASYRPTRYTEVYAGLIGTDIASHVYLSPNYFAPGVWSLYGDIEASVRPAKKLKLSAHVGSLVYLHHGYDDRIHYDWRIGASREFGRLNAQLALSGGGPDRDYYDHEYYRRTRLVVGLSCIF